MKYRWLKEIKRFCFCSIPIRIDQVRKHNISKRFSIALNYAYILTTSGEFILHWLYFSKRSVCLFLLCYLQCYLVNLPHITVTNPTFFRGAHKRELIL